MKLSVQPLLKSSLSSDVTLGPPPLAYPSNPNGVMWLDCNKNVFTDEAGTTPATEGQAIACWRSVGGDWGNNECLQSDADARPTLTSKGVTPDGIDDWMEFAQIDLSNTWTIYVVGDGYPESTSGYDNLRILGIRDNYPYEGCSLSALNYGSSWHSYSWISQYQSYLTPTHKMPKNNWMMRFRRASDWHHFIQCTEETEADIFTGTWTDQITYQWKRLFKTYAVTNQSACTFRLKQLVIVAEDTVASGRDAGIRAKLKQLTGVDL